MKGKKTHALSQMWMYVFLNKKKGGWYNFVEIFFKKKTCLYRKHYFYFKIKIRLYAEFLKRFAGIDLLKKKFLSNAA